MKRCKNCKHFKGEIKQPLGMCEVLKGIVNRNFRCIAHFEEKSYINPELWGKESDK